MSYEDNKKITRSETDFAIAIAVAEHLTWFAKDWTRHSSVQGVIKHLDNYSDLYNEGHIIISKDLEEYNF